MALTGIPLWIAEIVPPKDRGVLSDINPIFINIGYVSASWIGVGFFVYENANSWRAPITIGCLPCILCLACLWFVPESPRYYVLKDRTEDAERIVRKIHVRHGQEDFAAVEFEQMKQQIQFERSLQGGYLHMLRRPSYGRRVWMAVLLIFTLVNSGVLVINSKCGLDFVWW